MDFYQIKIDTISSIVQVTVPFFPNITENLYTYFVYKIALE